MIPLILVILLTPVVVVVEGVGRATVEVLAVELTLLAVVAFVRLVRLTAGIEDWSRRDELRLLGLLFD